MLKEILFISGKPGLYKLISSGKNMFIVESLADKKRMPAYPHDKIMSLGEIAMYTDADDIPLSTVLTNLRNLENGAAASINPKTATTDSLYDYMGKVLPSFDRDRVHATDIKRLIQWYNILIAAGFTEFEKQEDTEPAAE